MASCIHPWSIITPNQLWTLQPPSSMTMITPNSSSIFGLPVRCPPSIWDVLQVLLLTPINDNTDRSVSAPDSISALEMSRTHKAVSWMTGDSASPVTWVSMTSYFTMPDLWLHTCTWDLDMLIVGSVKTEFLMKRQTAMQVIFPLCETENLDQKGCWDAIASKNQIVYIQS